MFQLPTDLSIEGTTNYISQILAILWTTCHKKLHHRNLYSLPLDSQQEQRKKERSSRPHNFHYTYHRISKRLHRTM